MRVVLLTFALAVAAGPAHADATRDALTELAKCADITDSTLRLKCFDDAMPPAHSALTAPEPAPKEASQSFLEWLGLSRTAAPVTKPEEFVKPPVEPTGQLNA